MFPATRLASPLMVCAPVSQEPADIVWSDVVGVYVSADLVGDIASTVTEERPSYPTSAVIVCSDVVGVAVLD